MSARSPAALAGSVGEGLSRFLSSGALTGSGPDDISRFLDPTKIAPLRQFFESLDSGERTQVERLWHALLAVEAKKRQRAAALLEATAGAGADGVRPEAAQVLSCFASVLQARALERVGDGGNLYLGGRPPGAQQHAFELLRFRTPLIPFGYAAGNRATLELFADPTEITLIDVGIGRGGQIATLMRNPAARHAIKRLHVVGVEPDAAALTMAQVNIERAAAGAGIPLTFTPIAKVAECLTARDLQAAELPGTVIALSCLALHHLPRSEGGESRDAVLRILRDAGAAAIVVVEPDSNHHTDDPLLRFLHAYRHYRTVASSVYSTLPAADARDVFGQFFVPEVENIIGHQGDSRTERH